MNPAKHFVSAAAIVINEKDEILLIKGPQRGWEMPGGVVEIGESPAQAAIRETKEESGIDIEIMQFCGIFHNVKDSICNTLFLAKPVGGVPIITEESLETGFFPIEEALQMVNFMNFRARIEMCLNPAAHPIYVEF
ncbi:MULTISPECIES: NUDIX domain-containing protein [Paenibacillus]|uniref:NUDIX hydrolase n=1 Tax=Paenibacillus TaxID=44249 RepID=UPI000BBDC47E|nr:MULTISPECIES: NUDIX domain-containing protein [Paenibacillus]PCL90194.1 ADP-ribose pyrophosphatase [Paenibacillus lautus]WFB56818.1 NUDIX domain-containing protein [Paenibacillus sp. BR1-192]